MSRYEITDDGKLIRIGCPDGCMETLRPTEPDVGMYLDDIVIAAIRQQQSDIAALTAERDQLSEEVGLLTHKVICCGVAADHPDAGLTETGAYATKWNSAQAESVRKLRRDRDQLRARLAEVDAAPTVATVCIAPTSDFPVLKYSRYDIPRINGTELIARPAKDGGT